MTQNKWLANVLWCLHTLNAPSASDTWPKGLNSCSICPLVKKRRCVTWIMRFSSTISGSRPNSYGSGLLWNFLTSHSLLIAMLDNGAPCKPPNRYWFITICTSSNCRCTPNVGQDTHMPFSGVAGQVIHSIPGLDAFDGGLR